MDDTLLKVPPHNLMAEQKLLASIFVDPEQFHTVVLLVKPESFYKTYHQQVFAAMCKVVDSGETIDVLSVRNELEKQNAESDYAPLFAIADTMPTGAAADRYAKIVAEEYARRELIRATVQATAKAFDKSISVQELMVAVHGDIDTITVSEEQKKPKPLIDIVEKFIDQYMEGTSQKGVPTGLIDLDELWAGFFPGELTVLAGRPSMGKTALSLFLSKQVALYAREPVLFYSLEMSDEQLGIRYLASELNVDADALRRERVGRQSVEGRQSQALAEIARAPIYIQDEPNTATMDIYQQSAKMKREKGLALVVVDYLTLLTDDREKGDDTRALQVTYITRRLAAMAKKLHIPVLLLSQLSRKPEGRENRRPVASDLKESGGVEERADNVLLLYREKYYNPEKVDDILEIIIAKQKQGPRGVTAKVMYQAETGRFLNIAKRVEPRQALGGAYQQ